ncbi:MAG: CYTH and CHAD domain-containing protein [Rhodospirillales bacterium]
MDDTTGQGETTGNGSISQQGSDAAPATAGMETELKLAFRSDDLGKLTAFFGADPRSSGKRRLSTTYFDTADAALRDKGLALRVRRDGRRYVQTVKGENETSGGALCRREIEAPVRSSSPDLAAIPDPVIADLVQRSSLAGLKPVFRVDVERISLKGPAATPGVSVDIDVGEVKAGRRRAPICEVELESKGASLQALYKLALQLHQSVPLRVSKVTKSDTGYRLRAGDAPAPSKAAKLKLPADATAEQALNAIVSSCLDQLIANEPCVVATKDPEGIHQMRVALRRMRSSFRLFRQLLPAGQYDEIVGELRWLTSVLGPARDWDVFSAEIVGPVLAYLPEHEGLNVLQRRTDARRGRARRTAQEGVASPRFTALVLTLGQWLAESAWRHQDLSETSARLFAPARVFAADAIARRFKAVRKLGRRIETLPVAERHRLRIEVKKLRYAIEFFGSLFNRADVKSFARRLASLQDDLGYLNDVAVAAHLAGEVAEASRSPDREHLRAAEGLLIGWHGHAVAVHEDDLVRDVRQVLKAKRFWEADRP